MILVTGATGTVGRALIGQLVDAGHPVRAMVRNPRRLGGDRVRVQIALGDLADPDPYRNALRGVDTVIHLGASTRDQPRARIEELNGLATMRLLRSAERAGVGRFVFFSVLGASRASPTRFLRAKALAEEAVATSPLPTTVIAPSIMYSPTDQWLTALRNLAHLLPAAPVSGKGKASYQPIWAEDAARCTLAALEADPGRYELTGPETMTYEAMVRLVSRVAGAGGRVAHVPLPLARLALIAFERALGPATPVTWTEAELMEVPAISSNGAPGPAELGVEPRRMADVLGEAQRGPTAGPKSPG